MSLRLRLTLLYTSVLGIALLGLGWSVYGLLSVNLLGDIDRTLEALSREVVGQMAISQRIVTVLTAQGPRRILQGNLELPQLDPFAFDAFIQVTDAEDVVQARSGNLGTARLPAPPRDLVQHPGGVLHTFRTGGVELRVFHLPILVNGEHVGTLSAAKAVPTAILDRVRLLVGVGGAVALLAAGSLGWLIVRASVRPIERISAAARAIGESGDLTRRVHYVGPKDEVGLLAATFNDMLDRVENAYKKLEEGYAAQRRFVGDASHELRTPLTIIRGNLDILRRSPGDTEALQAIADEAERMSRMVGGLLTLARADAGQHLERGPVRLGEPLREACRQARHLCSHLAAFNQEGLEQLDGAVVMGDEDSLRQLFLILLDNACKYTPPGGTVTVRSWVAGGRAIVAVSDTGVGIDPKDLPHIFERFYRSPSARASGGTGLGLSIARWLVHEHGADISARSVPGKGSTFTVSLPLKS